MKMEELVLAYTEKTLTSIVEIEAFKMNEAIVDNVMKKLRQMKEGRCNRYGYVVYVTRLVDLQSAEMRAEDLQVHPVFQVRYNCILCTPAKDMLIVAMVDRITDLIICCQNGPLRIIVQQDEVNNKVFDTVSGGDAILEKVTGNKIEQGVFVRVRILNFKFLVYDKNIKVLGRLEGLATEEDRHRYFFDPETETPSSLRNKMAN